MISLVGKSCALCRRDRPPSSDVACTVSGRVEACSSSCRAYLHIALVTSRVEGTKSLQTLFRSGKGPNQVSFQVIVKRNKHEVPRGPPEFHLGLASFSALCWKPYAYLGSKRLRQSSLVSDTLVRRYHSDNATYVCSRLLGEMIQFFMNIHTVSSLLS
jgi:hypothetical protein